MITENQISVKKTARYYSIGKFKNDVKKIWFVFHGYGQLAKDFIKNFESISDNKTLIIAPEAFNKFYVRGFNGKIGSTWMTKEDRENEINDYVNMINNVYDKISRENNISKTQFNILGFSQGGHTAARWIDKSDLEIKNFYLWGSGLPRDIDYKIKLDFWNSVNLKLVVGNKDKFITREMLKEETVFLKTQKIRYELITYDGDHSINEYFLNKIDIHI